ncbi:hypothetical protein DITRI_Ditri01bG0109100 [Diplodiscus trichospermus]
MARKRPIQDPTPASSSEEEQGKENEQDDAEEESSQGNSSADGDAFEEDEDDAEEEEKIPLKKKKTDSGNVGSDSDRSLPSPNFPDKPVVTKLRKSARKSTLKPKPVATEPSSKQRKPSASVSNGGGDGSAKTPGTARLWSEADEIAILKGMIEYKSKKGSDPYADSSGFHDFIKEFIQADVSTYQLKEKIRRLRNKYKKNAEKGQNGDGPVFLKPHDHTSFKLSKKIWGSESDKKRQKKMKSLASEDEEKSEVYGAVTLGLPCFIKDTEDNAAVSAQVSSDSEEEKVDIWKDYPFLKQACELGSLAYVDGFKMLVEQNDGTIGKEKLRELEREATKLRMVQLELYLKRLELAREIARNVLDVIKGSEI